LSPLLHISPPETLLDETFYENHPIRKIQYPFVFLSRKMFFRELIMLHANVSDDGLCHSSSSHNPALLTLPKFMQNIYQK
jgi:hypothetical protein